MSRASLVLVVNAGSSSLKYQLLDPTVGATHATGIVERIGVDGHLRQVAGDVEHEQDVACPDHGTALDAALTAMRDHGPGFDPDSLLAVGHRVVHGGEEFGQPVVIDESVIQAVTELAPLAPLHNPANLKGIEATTHAFPRIPQVAVFDTAFHHTIPPSAHTYAVPREWRDKHGVRRYGFHGTSFAYVSRRAATLLDRPVDEVNLVVLHLGNGASACAVREGQSVETSMGLSPLEGLVMGTRSGDVDPSLGAYLARVAGLDPGDYDEALNRRSGLKGLTGDSDFREVQSRRSRGDADAGLAFDVTVHRLLKYTGGYAVLLGRVDALVFTGGIGENSPELRAAVMEGLGLLGLELDETANADGEPERKVTSAQSRVPAYVIPTNEELEIARACLEVLGAAGTQGAD
ncbi:MAG TPA: acetate kinase [Dermatophilaceae bacterium]|nr:acetate kinase [Dermatophilaceae bacterium]